MHAIGFFLNLQSKMKQQKNELDLLMKRMPKEAHVPTYSIFDSIGGNNDVISVCLVIHPTVSITGSEILESPKQ